MLPGKPVLLSGAYDLARLGYLQEEYVLSGRASAYSLAGPPSSDGVWSAHPSGSAAYVTPIVTMRPSHPFAFNGTVRRGPAECGRAGPGGAHLDGSGRVNVGQGAVMTVQGVGASLSPALGGWLAQALGCRRPSRSWARCRWARCRWARCRWARCRWARCRWARWRSGSASPLC